MKNLKAKFYRHRIIQRLGAKTGKTDFIIQWKFKRIPMPWCNVKANVFGSKKTVVFISFNSAAEAAYEIVELKKTVCTTHV